MSRDGADVAIALWVTGEVDAPRTLEALHAMLARWAVTATLVRGVATSADPLAAGAAPGPERSVARWGAGRRLLLTPSDPDWGAVGASAWDSAAWIACEPLDDGDSVVAVGRDRATMNDALAILPRVARGLGVLAASERAAQDAGTHAHALKNALTSIIMNMEVVHGLAQDAASAPDAALPFRGEALVAVRYALDSARAMVAEVDGLRRLAVRRAR